MHGPGIAQPQRTSGPSPGVLVFLRVIFVAIPVLTCGFLAWAPTLRIAILARNRLNWFLFTGNVALNILWIVFLAQDNTDDFSSSEGNIGMFGMLSTGVASISYFLYADITHYQRRRRLPYAGYYPPSGPQPPVNSGYAYGITQSSGPQTGQAPQTGPGPRPGPALGAPGPVHAPPPRTPQPSQPTQPPPAPQTQRPAGPRIDQVRAELDELSDLLRRDSGEGDNR